jgi:MFS family permease
MVTASGGDMIVTRPTLYPRYVTLLLLAIYIVNQLDRNVFDMLMEPIKQEMSLSDSQLGFLGGPALVVVYTLFGVPVARLADRMNRVLLMTIAILAWAIATMLTAAADTFLHLANARIGVGIGEAGFSAVAIALLSDLHGPSERGRAVAIFMLAIPISGIISSLVGGWVNQEYGWRAVYLLAGAPGIVFAALLILTVCEPRNQISAPQPVAKDRPGLKEVFHTLWGNRALRHLWIGQAIANIVACSTNWMVPYLIREYGIKTGELGTWFAVINVFGIASIALSGYLSSLRMFASLRAQARLLALTSLMNAPVIWLALAMPAANQTLLILIPAQIALLYYLAPAQSLSQSLSPPGMRATIASIFILMQVLVGGIVGVQGVGILSDLIALHTDGSASALRYAMIIAQLLTFWAAYHFWRAGKAICDDSARDDRNVCEVGDRVGIPDPTRLSRLASPLRLPRKI